MRKLTRIAPRHRKHRRGKQSRKKMDVSRLGTGRVARLFLFMAIITAAAACEEDADCGGHGTCITANELVREQREVGEVQHFERKNSYETSAHIRHIAVHVRGRLPRSGLQLHLQRDDDGVAGVEPATRRPSVRAVAAARRLLRAQSRRDQHGFYQHVHRPGSVGSGEVDV